MADIAQLRDIEARLAAATGPDRELEWSIADAFGHPAFDLKISLWPPFALQSPADRSIPRYTASIDATVVLCESKAEEVGIAPHHLVMMAIQAWHKSALPLVSFRTALPRFIVRELVRALIDKGASHA